MASKGDQSQVNQEPKDSSTKFVITSRQSSQIIASTLMGTGVLTLPRQATSQVHQSGWITTICAGVVIFFIMWAITKLGLRFRGKTFIEYTGSLLGMKSEKTGKIVALPIFVFFILYWLALAVISLRMFGELMVTSLLTQTPLEVVIGTMLLALLAFLIVELEVVARFNEVLLLLAVGLILIIVIFSFQHASLINIFPLFSTDIPTFLKDIVKEMFSYQGFTIMLLFMAYTQREKNTAAAFLGIAIPGISYAAIVFAAIATFGYEEIQNLTWPTLELVKSAGYSFAIFQRVESGFVAVWLIAVFTTIGNLLYAICFATAQLLPTKKEDKARKWVAVCILPIVFGLAFLPRNVYQLFDWLTHLGYVGLIAFAIPVILLFIAIIRKRGEGTRHERQRQKKPQPS